jgi:hypothetical protein
MSNGNNEKFVRVTLDSSGLPIPDQDPIELQKDNQRIRWCADFDFDIRIDGYSDTTKGAGGADCRYRVVSGVFGEIKTYKYTIIGNGQENDPDIVIKP